MGKTEKVFLMLAVLAALAVVLAPDAALAQNAPGPGSGANNWQEPATKILGLLESGFVKIGSTILGVGVVIIGAWATITSRLDPHKALFVVIGGILIVAGPVMLRGLLSVVGS